MDFGLFALSFSGAVDAATLIGALAVICLTLSAMQWCIAMLRNYAAGGVSRFHRPGSWAVVTGASRGFGAEFARDLASRGFNVFLLARDEKRMAALQLELKQKHNVDVKFASFDFAAPDVYGRASAALSSIGISNVSVLVNNVGFLSDIPELYLDHSREYVDRVISINISAMQEMTRLILPPMVEHGSSCKRAVCCIINVSSLSAKLTVPLMTTYSASKSHVTTFTSALATEYSGKVCVVSIEPGTANTDMCFNKHTGIGNPPPSAVAKSALDFVGCNLASFTPYYFHQLQRIGLKLLPLGVQTFVAKKTFESFRNALLKQK